MKTYRELVLSGQNASSAEWLEYLKEAHEAAPSMTPKAFDSAVTSAGLNSYELLTHEARQIPQTGRILDLACGDGHLINYLQTAHGPSLSIVGVDMSEAELAKARVAHKNPRVQFKRETADAISEPDCSIDAVLCHMAFMLMSPIDPVLKEIDRILQPGGLFAGVVSSSHASGFLLRYGQEFGAFAKEKHPGFKPHFGGDHRTRTKEGLKDLLSGFSAVEAEDFTVTVSGRPDEIAAFFEDMYNVTLLSREERKEFMARVAAMAKAECAGQSEMSFDFPMILFRARKKD